MWGRGAPVDQMACDESPQPQTHTHKQHTLHTRTNTQDPEQVCAKCVMEHCTGYEMQIGCAYTLEHTHPLAQTVYRPTDSAHSAM